MSILWQRLKTLLFNTSRWKQLMVVVLIATIFALPLEVDAVDWNKVGAVSTALATVAGCTIFGVFTFACVAAVGITAGATALIWGPGSFFGDLLTFFVDIVAFFASLITRGLLTLAASLLQTGIDLSVQKVLDENDPVSQVIINATTISRGIANLVLIAILIIIALATIVGIESYGIRRILPFLIGIILIVNFSTIFVGLVIDAGNTVMGFLWRNSDFGRDPNFNLATYVSSNMKLSSLGIARVANIDPSEKNLSASFGQAGNKILIIILGLLASYVFLRLAILFLLRLGVFWILIITAPLVFILGILPPLRNYLKDWWKQLFNWAFLGPLVFFFLFFGLIIWSLLNQQYFTDASPRLRNTSAVFVFPIILLFFIYALNISKKMAGAAANAVVDSVIGLGKAVAVGGTAFVAGAALAGVGGAILRRPWIKQTYERLQQSPSRALQATGRRLEVAHKAAVEEEQKRAKGVYSGIDALSSADIERRLPSMDARQKVQAAGILQERKERGLSREFAQEALTLSTSIDKEVERRLKRSAPHARYYSTEPQYTQTGNIRVADAYNYMVTNNIRGIELAPEALETPAIAGLLDYRQLTEIARRGTPQQLQSMIKGIEELTKSENIPMQLAIAAEIRKDAGAYQKALEGFMQKIQTEEIFKAGRMGEYVAPVDISGGGGGGTTTT